MGNVSKFEVLGIGASIAVMVFALVAVRDNGASSEVVTNEVNSQAAAVVVVDKQMENQNQALAEAVLSAASGADITKLIINDLKEGSGDAVKAGDTVSVHYIGVLPNGEQFDASYNRGVPFEFTVGAGRVIKGWEEGLLGMKEGGQRILIIPSDMAYGERGAGPIPPNATLVFAIELLEIK